MFLPASRTAAGVTLPATLASTPLDPQAGFDLPIGRFQATFWPRAGLFGPEGEPEVLLREPGIAGAIVTCLNAVWWIESEPAGDRTFTMTAYTEARAADGTDRLAVLSGLGTIDAGGGQVKVSLHTVPALARSDRHDQIAASVVVRKDGTYDGRVDVVEEKHKYGGGAGHGACHHRCRKQETPDGRRRCRRRCKRNRS